MRCCSRHLSLSVGVAAVDVPIGCCDTQKALQYVAVMAEVLKYGKSIKPMVTVAVGDIIALDALSNVVCTQTGRGRQVGWKEGHSE